MVGAQGFARPPITAAVGGGYAYLPLGPFLVGAQGGTSFGDGSRSRAVYGLATVGYAQSRAFAWQFYPFVGVGAASFRTAPGTDNVRPAFGAGFGADGLLSPARTGLLIGARIGYITRSLGDDESIAYAAATVGVGARRRTSETPGAVARRRP